jgi:hypothetical protein
MIPNTKREKLPMMEETMAAAGPANTKKDNKSFTEKIFNFESENLFNKYPPNKAEMEFPNEIKRFCGLFIIDLYKLNVGSEKCVLAK